MTQFVSFQYQRGDFFTQGPRRCDTKKGWRAPTNLLESRVEKVQVNKDNIRENSKRVAHDYRPGDQVLVTKDGHFRKLDAPYQGPFPITEVYVNGTVRIQRSVAVTERLNIRRITPYWT